MEDKQQRRRRRRGGPSKGKKGNARAEGKPGSRGPKKPRETSQKRVLPLIEPKRLDLSLSTTIPLSADEQAEMKTHIAFLRRYKAALRLSLNAAEDLLVNGVREPSDRGLCKHLLSKVNKKAVAQALAREPLHSDLDLRAEFLAGIVRLNPEVPMLLSYLETLSQGTEKRGAARAFSLTVDRIDFAELSSAQFGRLLDVLARTFEGPHWVQALFGLFENEHFDKALRCHRSSLTGAHAETVLPLALAYDTVVRGAPLPEDESGRHELLRGMKAWLSAPTSVLIDHPEKVRIRLAEFGLRARDLEGPVNIPRALIDSIPRQDPEYPRLGLLFAEAQLAQGRETQAAALLKQIVQSHPKRTRAVRLLEGLAWPKSGRVTIMPPEAQSQNPAERGFLLARGFWLDGASFVWVKTTGPEGRARLLEEGEIQRTLHFPGMLPALAVGPAGSGDEGAFVAILGEGWPLLRSLVRLSALDAVSLGYEGLKILHALAGLGFELPDAEPTRFVGVRGRPCTLKLADMGGIQPQKPKEAAIAHGVLAVSWVKRVLSENPLEAGGELRQDLPLVLRARLRGHSPLPLLAHALARFLAEHHGPKARSS